MKSYFLALGTVLVVCVGCAFDAQQTFEQEEYHAPPAAMLQRPGPMVDGPGPGVIAMMAAPAGQQFATESTQVKFVGPLGLQVGWRIGRGYADNQLVAPGSYDFGQSSTYQLKLTGIPGRDGMILYPSLQIYPTHPTTDAYLSHNSIPLELTDEDLDQVQSNNFVTKVIYLPDPKFQELAIAGVETLVSTRLDPGVDPVAEADRRGTIMAVLRVGNKDLEMPAKQPQGGNGAAQAGIQQTSMIVVDGAKGQHVPPVPIATSEAGLRGVPNPMIVGGSGVPGHPAQHPIAGMGAVPSWGMPMTSTPIGLPGPPHLPFGGPAGLQSHTIRDRSENDLGKPVDHFLIDVRREPGYSLPKPVRHVEYTERHPVLGPGQVSQPAWANAPAGQ